MSDEDDFITVNITRNQAGALIMALLLAEAAGLLHIMPTNAQDSLYSFSQMMETEIENQKINTNNN